jgi:hypothetical protein
MIPVSERILGAAEVLCVLKSQIDALLADAKISTVERARTVAYVASVALRAIESATLEERLAAVEQVLSEREAAA